MLVNPDIQAWFDKLQGRPARGGSAPRGAPQNYAGAALEGIVQPGRGMFGFNAPSITDKFQPRSPAPYPGQQPMRGIPPVAPSSQGGGGRDLGGAAIAAGLGRLGQGIQQGLGDWAERRKAQADAQAVRDTAAASASRGFLSPKAPRAPIASEPEASSKPPTPTFQPVGPASEKPLLTQPGGGVGAMGTSISPASASLPTFAQGAPSQEAASGPGFVDRFLTGLKAGEGVSYSGHSPTGAIGAYGLTGDFIKRYAPGAGLPTDRASYERDPALQDQLARYAANKMYTEGMYPGGNFPNATGDWRLVSNGWLAGSPHGTPQPGNMSSEGYANKVMNAANAAGPPPLTTPSAAAYAALPPSTTEPTAPRLAGAVPAPDTSSQTVIPGQTDPHKPGFDPGSVQFHRTPEMDQQPAAAPAPVEVGKPQTGPAYSDETWNNRPKYDYSAQPPILNGGQPGVYSAPQIGPQGMNAVPGQQYAEAMPRHGETIDQYQYRQLQEQPGGINPGKPPDSTPALPQEYAANPLAAALAGGAGDAGQAAALANGNQPQPQLDQSAMLALALSQNQPDLGDFGGFFG